MDNYLDDAYYAVFSGDGNNGVSHMSPDYVVYCNDPFCLVQCAAISSFKKGTGQKWARENMEVDGDDEMAIVTFRESPEQQEEREKEQREHEGDDAYEEDEYNFSDNGSWLIYEVSPWTEDVTNARFSVFNSGEEAFDEALWKEFNKEPKRPPPEPSDMVSGGSNYEESTNRKLTKKEFNKLRIGDIFLYKNKVLYTITDIENRKPDFKSPVYIVSNGKGESHRVYDFSAPYMTLITPPEREDMVSGGSNYEESTRPILSRKQFYNFKVGDEFYCNWFKDVPVTKPIRYTITKIHNQKDNHIIWATAYGTDEPYHAFDVDDLEDLSAVEPTPEREDMVSGGSNYEENVYSVLSGDELLLNRLE